MSSFYGNAASSGSSVEESWISDLIATTENSTIASKNYAIGDYLILNNIFYKVISAITSGTTIEVGTNIAATTITNEIKSSKPYVDSNNYIVF